MASSSWIEITAEFSEEPEDWSVAAAVLSDLGISSSRVESNPPRIISCVAAVAGYENKLHEIEVGLTSAGATSFLRNEIKDSDWLALFREHFKPRAIGNRLAIIPSWDPDSNFPGRLLIRLDPGQAFGTGDHPTTKMCLELLEDSVSPGFSVLDLGCGSAILSIAAKKLGAKSVVATDIEPISVEIAKENALENNSVIEVICCPGFDGLTPQTFNLIVSNIISATLIRLAPKIPKWLTDSGIWIVSGVIESNWEDVKEAAEGNGFKCVKHKMEGEWVAAEFSMNSR